MFGATMSLHPKVKSPSKTCRSVATRGQLNGLRCRLQQQGSPSPMESPQQGHLQASGPGLQDGNTAFAALQMCQEKCALVLLSMDLYPCSPQQQTSELHPCAGLLQLSYPYAPSELGSFFQSRAQASFFGILCPEIQCSPSQAVSLPPSSAPQPTSKPSLQQRFPLLQPFQLGTFWSRVGHLCPAVPVPGGQPLGTLTFGQLQAACAMTSPRPLHGACNTATATAATRHP